MLSLLTITNRPKFRPWLEWVVGQIREAVPDLEHVIIEDPKTLGAGRRAAQELATRSWCMWLDDDDYLAPSRVCRMLQSARDEYDIIWQPCTDLRVDLKTGGARWHTTVAPVPHRDWLFRRDTVPKMNPMINRAEELEWIERVNDDPRLCWLMLPREVKGPFPPTRWSLEHETNVSETRDDRYRSELTLMLPDAFYELQRSIYG